MGNDRFSKIQFLLNRQVSDPPWHLLEGKTGHGNGKASKHCIGLYVHQEKCLGAEELGGNGILRERSGPGDRGCMECRAAVAMAIALEMGLDTSRKLGLCTCGAPTDGIRCPTCGGLTQAGVARMATQVVFAYNAALQQIEELLEKLPPPAELPVDVTALALARLNQVGGQELYSACVDFLHEEEEE